MGSFLQERVITKDLKMIFTASLLDVQHKWGSMGKKSASLFVVSLGKALNGMPPSSCGRQVAPPTRSARVVVWRLVKIDPLLLVLLLYTVSVLCYFDVV